MGARQDLRGVSRLASTDTSTTSEGKADGRAKRAWLWVAVTACITVFRSSRSTLSSATALGRVGQADDIGPVLASVPADENRWTTGQRIEASGGMFL